MREELIIHECQPMYVMRRACGAFGVFAADVHSRGGVLTGVGAGGSGERVVYLYVVL